MKKILIVLTVLSLMLSCLPYVYAEEDEAVPVISQINVDYASSFSSAPLVISGENISKSTRVFSMNSPLDLSLSAVESFKLWQQGLEFPEFDESSCVEDTVLSQSTNQLCAVSYGHFYWLVNGKNISKPYFIGNTKYYWKDSDTVAVGGTLRICGASFLDTVRVVMLNGDDIVDLGNCLYSDAISARENDNYLLNIRIPIDTKIGKWEIFINGGSSEYGWVSAGTVEITEPQKEKAYINLKKYGAKGDGITDDTDAFVKALKAASKKQADVYVEPGTYFVSKTIEIPENVGLFGSSASNTVIKGVGFDAETANNISWFSSDNYVMNVPYSVIYLHNRTSINGLTVTGAVNQGMGGYGLVQIGIDDYTLSSGGTCSDIIIYQCTIDAADQDNLHGDRWYRNAIYSIGSVERVKIIDNSVNGALHLGGYGGVATRCDIINNKVSGGYADDVQAMCMFTVDSLIDSNTITDSPGRFVVTPIMHTYIRYNTFENFEKNTWDNSTEGILAHGENSHVNRTAGYVSGATGNTLTDSDSGYVAGIYKKAVVVITHGKGAGQYRIVKDNTVDTLELFEEFTVVPDNTSEYIVGHFITENIYFNNTTDGVGHLGMSNDLIGNIIDHHRDDRGGIVFDSRDNSTAVNGEITSDTLTLSWYNVISSSWLDGSAIQMNSFAKIQSAFNSISSFANLITGSLVNMSASDRNGMLKGGPVSSLITVSGTDKSDRYDQAFTVIYSNTLSNAQYGVNISKYAENTIVYRNKFINVDQPVLDYGARTSFLQNTASVMSDGEETDEYLADFSTETETLKVTLKPKYTVAGYDKVRSYKNQNLSSLISSVSHRDVNNHDCTQNCAKNLKNLWELIKNFENKNEVLPNAEYYPEDPTNSTQNIIKLLGKTAFDFGICSGFSEDIQDSVNITYLWNEQLNGQSLKNLADPQNTWVLMDVTAVYSWMITNDFAGHEGGYNVLFADGSVKHFQMSEMPIKKIMTDVVLLDSSIPARYPSVCVYSPDSDGGIPWKIIIPAGVVIIGAAVCMFIVFFRKKRSSK